MAPPAIGEPAPRFEATDHTGRVWNLKTLHGRHAVLFFYPRNDTPGCVRQALAFRDMQHLFEHSGAVLLGVSPDDITSHRRFADRYKIDFGLIPDPDRRLIHAFGVAQGSTARRCTFLLAPDGTVRRIWQTVLPDSHPEEVLRALQDESLRINA